MSQGRSFAAWRHSYCAAAAGDVSIEADAEAENDTSNAHVVREDVVLRLLAATMRGSLETLHTAEGALAGFMATAATASKAAARRAGPARAALDKAVARAEARVQHACDVLERLGFSDAMRDRLRDAEGALADAKAARDAAALPAPAARAAELTPELLGTLWDHLERLFAGLAKMDPELAQAELARWFDKVTVTPRTVRRVVAPPRKHTAATTRKPRSPVNVTWELTTGFLWHEAGTLHGRTPAPENLARVLGAYVAERQSCGGGI